MKSCCFTEAPSLSYTWESALGSGGSLSSALNSGQLADLLGRDPGPGATAERVCISATAQTAPCVVASSGRRPRQCCPRRTGSARWVRAPSPAALQMFSVGACARLGWAGCPWQCIRIAACSQCRTHVHHATRVDPTALPLVIHDLGEQPHGLGWGALHLSLPGAYACIARVAAPWSGF